MAAKATKQWQTSAVFKLLWEKSARTNTFDCCKKRSSPGISAFEIALCEATILLSEGRRSKSDNTASLNKPGLLDKLRVLSKGHKFNSFINEATCSGCKSQCDTSTSSMIAAEVLASSKTHGQHDHNGGREQTARVYMVYKWQTSCKRSTCML